MNKGLKWIILTLALCLLASMVAMAEEEKILSAPVDEKVEELEQIDLWTEEIARAVEEDEAQAATSGTDFQIENGVLVKYLGRDDVVIIPDDVTAIGDGAFQLSDVRQVYIPNTVASIGEDAFNTCLRLSYVFIPDSVTHIGSCAFASCWNLSELTIPDSVTFIDQGVFQDSGVKRVTLPRNLRTLKFYLFAGCKNLESIAIPDSVTGIEDGAFAGCTALTDVAIPGGVNVLGEFGYGDVGPFSGCTGLTRVTLADGIGAIGNDAFGGCTGLTRITVPQSVRRVGEGAFNKCVGLTDVTVESADIAIDDAAFEGCPQGIVFHTICQTPATLWAREHGYTVEATDHTPVTDPAVTPTLTSEGRTEGSHCSVCGEVLVEQEKIDPLIDIKNSKINAIADKSYTGKAIKPKPVVKCGGVHLTKGTDYTVAYKNNTKIGKATVTVKGIGKYGGTKKATFRINPKKVAVSKLTAGKKKLTVQWKKTAGGAGYQIQYGLKKNFSGANTVTITKAATVKKVLKSLKSGKTYYVRIRGYKKVGKVKYVSKWSSVKKAKVK